MNGTAMTSAYLQINEEFNISDEHFPHSYWPVFTWTLGGAASPLVGLSLMEHFGVKRGYLVSAFSYVWMKEISKLAKRDAYRASDVPIA